MKKYFIFRQNNSGGYYVIDTKIGVGKIIIVKAYDIEEAWNKMEEIRKKVEGFWDYCECCGVRWESDYEYGGEDGIDFIPSEYRNSTFKIHM